MANPNPSPATRFKPGQSGNPAGPKVGTRSVSSRLRDLLEKGEVAGKPIKDGKQVADLLAEVILKEALKGDYRFAQMVLDRTEGKVPDSLTVNAEKPRGVGSLRDFLHGDDDDDAAPDDRDDDTTQEAP